MALQKTFISIQRVVNEIVQTLNLQEDHRISYVYALIDDCVSLLGLTFAFDEKQVTLDVKNHVAELPCDFYAVRQIAMNSRVLTPGMQTVSPNLPEIFGKTEYNTRDPYTYYIDENCIIVGKKEAKINLYYLAFKQDIEGYPMILNDREYIEAILAYVQYKLKKAEAFAGKVDINTAIYWEQEFRKQRVRLKGKANLPTVDEAYAIGRRFRRMIPQMLSDKSMHALANVQERT